MRRASSARLQKLVGWLAVLCIVFVALLQGKPYFTNAARPPRGILDPGVALQVARDIGEIDDILADAPSPDREVMRFKQYIDFGFVGAYTGLFLALASLLSRGAGWARVAGAAAMVCAAATGFFDLLENLAILRILDVPLRFTTAGMIHAIRSASTAKWVLAGVTLALLSTLFLKRRGWLSRAAGGLFIVSAVFIFYGFHDNRFLVFEGFPGLASLIAIAALFFRALV
jgi:hypothetical protein